MATRIQEIDTSWFNATLNFTLVDDVAYEFQNAGSHDIYYHESGTEPAMDEIGLILRPGESWRTLRQIAGLNVYFRVDSSNPDYKSRLILQESTVFESGGGGTTNPGGSDQEVQFNESGVFGGVPILLYNATLTTLTSSGTGINGVVLDSAGAGTDFLADDGTYKTIGGSTPGGSDTQVQFNNAGGFDGISILTYDENTNELTSSGTGINGVLLDSSGTGNDFLSDDGTYKTITPTPGGSDTQFQYNDSGTLGGVTSLTYNDISGDITSSGNGINGVVLDSSGAGSQALFDDGAYKAITASAGGSDTQIQYNDGGVLGGMINGLYNDTSGDITLTSTTVNGVDLDSTGGGTDFLADDGTYKSVPADSPGGSDTQLQYNDGGAFGGVSIATFNDTLTELTLTSTTVNSVDLDATGGGTDFLADDGTYKSVGGGSPGGSDTQFQYNDGGSFGGVSNATFNDTSGDITLTSTEVNGVTLDSTGSGTQVLFNDGTYQSIATEDSIITGNALKTVTTPLFTFPVTSATDLAIVWDSTLLQPVLINNAAGDTILYTFRAIWDIPSESGYPARHYQSSQEIVGVGTTYFTNTNAAITGLELNVVPANLELYMQLGNTVTGENTNIKVDIMLDVFSTAPTLEFVRIFGYFQEATP